MKFKKPKLVAKKKPLSYFKDLEARRNRAGRRTPKSWPIAWNKPVYCLRKTGDTDYVLEAGRIEWYYPSSAAAAFFASGDRTPVFFVDFGDLLEHVPVKKTFPYTSAGFKQALMALAAIHDETAEVKGTAAAELAGEASKHRATARWMRIQARLK